MSWSGCVRVSAASVAPSEKSVSSVADAGRAHATLPALGAQVCSTRHPCNSGVEVHITMEVHPLTHSRLALVSTPQVLALPNAPPWLSDKAAKPFALQLAEQWQQNGARL